VLLLLLLVFVVVVVVVVVVEVSVPQQCSGIVADGVVLIILPFRTTPTDY
jgi:hypothetical protein